MSIIRADSIKNRAGNGAPDFPNGITVTGVVTSTSISQNISGDLTVTGNLGVGGTVTYEDVTNIDSIGIVTARSGINVSSGDINISSGKVGISSIIPASKLTVKGGSIFVGDNNMHGGSAGVIEYGGNTGNFDLKGYSMGGQSTIRMFTSLSGTNAERLRINNAGAIGLSGANYGSSGQVLTSQGSGSAVAWTTLSSGLFSGVALLQDQKSAGTHGGQPPNNSGYFERDLNTEVFDTGNFVSLSSNNFTLTAGTYLLQASIPAHRTNNSKALLYNVSDGTTVAYSQVVYIRDAAVQGGHINLTCRFTIGGAKTFDIRQRVGNIDGEGLGNAAGYDTEIYTQVLIFKEN